tara:strand:+ start:163 stop:1110 length:948 start_codon:yes stop_codon:yes gene_type:complete
MNTRGLFLIIAPLLAGALFLSTSKAQDNRKKEKAARQWEYLDNGVVRIGVDKSRGACIGYFGRSEPRRNLLNNRDEGRFVQQSYYGAADGSKWNGKPWVYNPVQGGHWKGKKSRLLGFSRDEKKKTISARIEPLSWASGITCPEAIMGVTISLEGPLARIRFRMDYTGKNQSVVRDQEMPAVFVDAALSNLVYSENGKLKRRVPGWPNERGKTSESWVAYLDEKDWGVGICTPGTETFTCYRFRGDGKTGPTGSACSYVAPLRRFSLQKGLVVDYEVFLTIGSLAEIRSRFYQLRSKRPPASPSPGKKPQKKKQG